MACAGNRPIHLFQSGAVDLRYDGVERFEVFATDHADRVQDVLLFVDAFIYWVNLDTGLQGDIIKERVGVAVVRCR